MFEKYSLTIAGVVVSVAGTVLVQVGFSDACSNEIIKMAPVIVGGIMSYIGRLRNGDVTVAGFKQ